VKASGGRRGILCGLAAAAGIALTIACYYPGYVTSDPVDQLSQARKGIFSDWHPPVMGWVWGRFDRVVPGPAGMLLLHNVLFWGALALVADTSIEGCGGLAAATVLGVGLLPPVFALLGTIWKDVGLAAALLLAFALLLRADRQSSKIALLLALPPLFYGFAVRHNAVVAVAPLSVWFGLLLARLCGLGSRRKALAATAAAAALLAGFAGLRGWVTYGVLRARRTYPVQQILIHDLAAVSIATRSYQLPEFLSEAGQPSTVEELEDVYSPDLIDPLFCCDDTVPRFYILSDAGRFDLLLRTWLRVIPRNPKAYLPHRARAFKRQFGIGGPEVCFPFQQGSDPNALRITFQPGRLNQWMTAFMSWFKNGILFRGWFYLLGAASGLGLAVRSEGVRRRASVALAASGLAYAGAYFFVGTTCDFRMAWWTVVSTLALPVVLAGSYPERTGQGGMRCLRPSP